MKSTTSEVPHSAVSSVNFLNFWLTTLHYTTQFWELYHPIITWQPIHDLLNM